MANIKRKRTYVAKPPDIHPVWHLIDATDKRLGRLASEIATLLMGKHRPIYTPTIMTGDFVVVINASKVGVTGKKMTQKEYYSHSGYPGGLRTTTLEQMMDQHPTRVIQMAVKGMLPKSTLGGRMLRRLRAYPGESHPHEAQIKGYGVAAPEAEASEDVRGDAQ